MITKRSKTTANNQPKQSIPTTPTGRALGRVPAVSTKAKAAQPLTSAEFLHQLQEQRNQQSTTAAVEEELVEAIMAVATPALVIDAPDSPATDAAASPPGGPRAHEIVKLGIDVMAGVIDPDYTGELQVLLLNTDMHRTFKVKPGDRIAQLILERADIMPIEEVDALDDTARGAGGYGSTGV